MSLFSPSTGPLALAVMITAMSACQPEVPLAPEAVSASMARHQTDNAAVYWNEVARDLVASTLASTPFAIRGYAILSVAQYQAVVAAERGKVRNTHPSTRAAISAASVAALSYLFPAKADELEAQLDEFMSSQQRPGRRNQDVESGYAIGRSIAAEIVERADTDGFFAPWTGTVPVGPGVWYSSTNPPTPPAGPMFGQARTFMLRSGDQFRPAPPPAFGSAAFDAATAKVRHYSDTRTPEQDSLAKFWHLPAGTYAPPGYWNEEAATLAVKYRLNDRKAAHVFALTNIVMYDALIASHEAKYHYWLLRPSQADPDITLSVGLPNFPSYPSNHAAISAGAAKILGRSFPAEKTRLHGLGEQAAMSRVYGGIHYRFDGDAGMKLGRTIADWVLKQDARGGRPLVLR